jgi:hypothetical protein
MMATNRSGAPQSLGSPAFEPVTEAPGDYVRQA